VKRNLTGIYSQVTVHYISVESGGNAINSKQKINQKY